VVGNRTTDWGSSSEEKEVSDWKAGEYCFAAFAVKKSRRDLSKMLAFDEGLLPARRQRP
jgi:hypothetical protein